MRPAQAKKVFTAIPLLLVVLAVWAISASGQPPQPAPKKPEVSTEPKLVGAGRCILCHGTSDEELKKAFPRARELILGGESKIWDREDLHKTAFTNLKGKLGEQMTAILRMSWGANDAGWTVQKDARCLTCHAVDLHVEKETKTENDFQVGEFGVSCEVCHGFASKWDTPHSNTEWRENSPETKKADYGELDMRSPKKRAEKCSSCHIGNLKEGKFVTHEMYAAGHPPLPPFEVASFSRDQRMHFKYAKDLDYIKSFLNVKDEAKRAENVRLCWERFHYHNGESQVVRHLAVGAVMTCRAAIELLIDEIKKSSNATVDHSLDFAHFDCYACHHDLKYPSDRQKRGYAGVPGRPQVRAGALALTRIVVEHAISMQERKKIVLPSMQEFKPLLEALIHAFSSKPFGNPPEVQAAAEQLVKWADLAVEELGKDQVLYDSKESAELMHLIMKHLADPNNHWIDPDSAQQLVWAVETLREAMEDDSRPLGAIWDKLEGSEKLTTRCSRLVRGNNPKGDYSNSRPIADELPGRMQRINDFQLDPLRQMFIKLSDAAKREKPK